MPEMAAGVGGCPGGRAARVRGLPCRRQVTRPTPSRPRRVLCQTGVVAGVRGACNERDVMAKNLTVRLDDELAADTEALARAEGNGLNETVKARAL